MMIHKLVNNLILYKFYLSHVKDHRIVSSES